MTASPAFDLQKLAALSATAGLNRLAGFEVVAASDGAATRVGGDLTIGRAPAPIFSGPPDPALGPRAVTETFTSLGPQVSLNFGNGNGWSYLSGGVGLTTWSIVPAGVAPLPVDEDRLRTLNYGGGARWFAKKHLAFSLDVRFHRTRAGVPQAGNPAVPATLLLIIGAGVSFK